MSISNYDKMDVFADILEPATMIIADPEVMGMLTRKEPIIRAVKHAIKYHKDEVIEILSRVDGLSPEEYQFDGIKVTFQMLGFLNRPDVLQKMREVFTSSRNDADVSSGAAMEIIEGGAN